LEGEKPIPLGVDHACLSLVVSHGPEQARPLTLTGESKNRRHRLSGPFTARLAPPAAAAATAAVAGRPPSCFVDDKQLRARHAPQCTLSMTARPDSASELGITFGLQAHTLALITRRSEPLVLIPR